MAGSGAAAHESEHDLDADSAATSRMTSVSDSRASEPSEPSEPSEVPELPGKSSGVQAWKPSSLFLKNARSRTTSDIIVPSMWRVWLGTLLRTSSWDVFTGVIIIADIVLTCVDIDLRAVGIESPLWLTLCSTLCLAIYVFELAANFIVRGLRVLKEPWSILDVVIVFSGVLQASLGLVNISLDSVAVLRMLRVVRILRLFRLFKKFAMLKELRKLLLMTASCFKTLCWSFLFCFIVMTAWAMLAVEMLWPTMSELVRDGLWEDCAFCERSLTSVMTANLLLFKTVVATDSWGRVAVPLIQQTPFAAVIFVGSHLTIVFGVLNLVVAVVVDQFAEQRSRDVTGMAMEMEADEEEDLKKLDKMFEQIDGDGDGELTLEELLDGAGRVREFQNRLRVMDIDQADLSQLFGMLDSDGGGTIDPEEFKQTLTRWQFDSKTATRFVRYALQQLMNDHSSAAQKLDTMEERLQCALENERLATRKPPRSRKWKYLRGSQYAQRYRRCFALPCQKRLLEESWLLAGDHFGPWCQQTARPSQFLEAFAVDALQPI